MKKTRLSTILLSVLTLLCSIFILASCGGNNHTHNYSNEWSKDGSYHWQACSGCEETRNKAEHDWNSGVVTLQPTNTSEGSKTYTCNTCGQTKVDSIPVLDTHEHVFSESWSSNDTHHWHSAACEHTTEKKNYGEHDWNSGVVTTEPTTTSNGVKTFTCQSCGKTKTADVPKLEEEHTHVYNQQNTNEMYISSAATCAEKAKYFYSCTCGLQGTETFEYGEAAGHQYSSAWSYNDTHHWHAATCEHSSEKKDNGEHDWNSGVVTTEPTTTSNGVKTFTCQSCGKTKTADVPKLEEEHTHVYNQQNTNEMYISSAATCAEKAKYFYSCTCGLQGTETFEYGEAAGHQYSSAWSYNDTHHWHAATCEHSSEKKDNGEHDWNEGVVTTEPTTTSKGVKTFTCAICNKTKTEDIPELEEVHSHVYNHQNTDDDYLNSKATCTAKATYFYSCSCGLEGTETFEHGSLAAHTFTTYTPNGNATCTKDGTKTATCDVCHTATDEVADVGSAKGHTYSTEWTSDDTHHWHASNCGHTSETSDKETHHWGAGVVTKQPTETTEGEKTYTCDVCQKTKVDSIGKLDHIHTYDSEYTSDDNYHWYAATCVHTSEVKDKSAHRWNAGVITSEATVYDEGVKLYTCQDCGHTKEESIEKISSFTVVFYDIDNRIISKNNYKLNTASSQIVIPSIQAEEGFQFEAWINIYDSKNITDIDFSKASANEVYQFKPNFVKIHEVIFIDYEGNQLGETLIVKDGEKITASNLPIIPTRTGYTSKWDEQILSTKITGTKVFVPVYEVITFAVTFLDAKNGNEITTSTVEYGSFAIIPECNLYRFDAKLYGFTGWKSSTTDTFIDNVNGNKLTNVYSDLTVYAVYEESIEQPVLAVHIDGTTVTMSLCMPDGSSLYSINMSMGWVTEKGICEVTGATVSNVTPLNKGNCGEENCTVYTDKVDWLVYNNKAKTVDFIWNCGNGHSFNTSTNVITLTFGVDDGAQITESIFSMFDDSNVVYGENGANINNLNKSNITIWFY